MSMWLSESYMQRHIIYKNPASLQGGRKTAKNWDKQKKCRL